MQITHAHVEFWQSKQPVPNWVKKQNQKYKVYKGDIHGCINAHAGVKNTIYLDTLNLIVCIKIQRKHTKGSLIPYLEEIAENPGTLIRPEKRAALARKWANKIRLTH
jgi:hypothetical protein